MTPARPLQRRSIRLQNYDYTQANAYFVTICTQHRRLFFEHEKTWDIAQKCWSEIPVHFPHVELDEWVLMPNHIHGIIVFAGSDNTMQTPRQSENHHSLISPKSSSLGTVIRSYKSAVTRLARLAQMDEFAWQRNYYEHIIRDEADLHRIRHYIVNNPSHWLEDDNNPQSFKFKIQ
jgi:REP element-mobilizing transposase RayT